VSAQEQRLSPPLPATHTAPSLASVHPQCAPLYSTIPHRQSRSLPTAPHPLPTAPPDRFHAAPPGSLHAVRSMQLSGRAEEWAVNQGVESRVSPAGRTVG